MKTYKVTLISKDGQKFEINVNAYSDDESHSVWVGCSEQ